MVKYRSHERKQRRKPYGLVTFARPAVDEEEHRLLLSSPRMVIHCSMPPMVT
jgi:hypothetical protein